MQCVPVPRVRLDIAGDAWIVREEELHGLTNERPQVCHLSLEKSVKLSPLGDHVTTSGKFRGAKAGGPMLQRI
jgi:hypothetical protein